MDIVEILSGHSVRRALKKGSEELNGQSENLWLLITSVSTLCLLRNDNGNREQTCTGLDS